MKTIYFIIISMIIAYLVCSFACGTFNPALMDQHTKIFIILTWLVCIAITSLINIITKD